MQGQMNTNISYIQVSSSNRNKPSDEYDTLLNLPPYPISFTNGSSIITLNSPGNTYKVRDTVNLSNILSKSTLLQNVLMMKHKSNFARIFHKGHGLSLFGLYDPHNPSEFMPIDYVDMLPASYSIKEIIPDTKQYYILKINSEIDLTISLSGIKGNDASRNFIGRIPANFLNGTHRVYLLFTRNASGFTLDPDSYIIKLNISATINYLDGVNLIEGTKNSSNNTLHIKYNNLYGIPLTYLNSEKGQIVSVTADTFSVNIKYPAIVDPNYNFYNYNDTNDNSIDFNNIIRNNRGGGNQVYARRLLRSLTGASSTSNYTISLDKTYNNIQQVRIISSTFPNSQKIINNTNNRLYWRNYDSDEIYQLEVPPGNYDPNELENTLRRLFNSIPREIGNNTYINGSNRFHIVDVNINTNSGLVEFSSYKELLSENNIQIPVGKIEITVPFRMDVNSPPTYIYIAVDNSSTNYLYNLKSIDNIVEGILDLDRKIVIYLSSKRGADLNSINTDIDLRNSVLINTNQLVIKNHDLKLGDIIITDQFDNLSTISVYEITGIIDNTVTIRKSNIRIVYESILINFDIDNNLNDVIGDVIPIFSFQPIMIVNHKGHQLNVGDKINISGSMDIFFTPEYVINKDHLIYKIIDDNSYWILLPPYTPLPDFKPMMTNVIAVRYPALFQLFFNRDDTLGELLGFRDVNSPHAVTPYNYSVKNTDAYIYHNSISRVSYPAPILNFNGPDIFYISCPELSNKKIDGTGIPDVFAIIRWTENPGAVSFDSFVPITVYFNPLLGSLTSLTFSFYNPNGTLVDFNNVDHSFTLEIMEIINQ